MPTVRLITTLIITLFCAPLLAKPNFVKSSINTSKPHLNDLPREAVTHFTLPNSTGGKAGFGMIKDNLIYLPLNDDVLKAYIHQMVEHKNGDISVTAVVQPHSKEHVVVATFSDRGGFIDVLGPDLNYNMEISKGKLSAINTSYLTLNHATEKNDSVMKSEFPMTLNTSDIPVATPEAPTVVDIMLIYTQNISARYPQGLAESLMNHLVVKANQAFADSLANVQLNLVHNEEVFYDSPNSYDAFDDLYAAIAGHGNHPGLMQLHTLRQTYGADLVSMIRTHRLDERGVCGLALTRPNEYGVIGNVSNYGMHGGSHCLGTFTHEVGHNFNARHHNDPGGPSYAKGYVKENSFTTLMGAFGTGSFYRTRKLHNKFSSPLTRCAGSPCGNADNADNVRAINTHAPEVAALMESKHPEGVTALLPIPIDSDGDGVFDSEDAFPFDNEEQIDSDDDGTGDNSDLFPYDATEQLDSDGDGTGNNSDSDDDNDNVLDINDVFPLDPNETADADNDGIGDNADAFVNNSAEQFNNDNDAFGNREDLDDDNDGVNDFESGDLFDQNEIWVTDAQNDNIVRIDTLSEQSLGYVLEMDDGAFNYRSQLLRVDDNQLMFIGFSDVYLYDRQHKQLKIAIPRNDLANNFATDIIFNSNGDLIVSGGSVDFTITRFKQYEHKFIQSRFFEDSVYRDLITSTQGDIYAIDRTSNKIARLTPDTIELVNEIAHSLLNKPEQIEVLGNTLLVSNFESGQLLRYDMDSRAMTIFADTDISDISCIKAAFGRIFLCDRERGQVQVLNEATGDVLSIISSLPENSEPVDLVLMPKVLDTEPFNANNDSDNDGVPNSSDTLPLDPSDTADTDNDGQPNNTDEDDDNDGMPDIFEIEYGLDALEDDSSQDADSDGVSNLEEFQGGTNPIIADNNQTSTPPPATAPSTPSDKNSSSGGGALSWILLCAFLLRRKIN